MNKEPCPFCGSDNLDISQLTQDNENIVSNIICMDCGAQGPWMYQKSSEITDTLVKLWNLRNDRNKQYSASMKEYLKRQQMIKDKRIYEIDRGPMHDSWTWNDHCYYYSTPEEALDAMLKLEEEKINNNEIS